ncbi:MAG: TetR/AcrR family transcriptional regulator, partial [Bacteroidales bacterium]|nr:TetR/AcrR family transcriptional regulator [Bacteroidales bacterium]
FIQKGMTGARMQEIADKANINKALLHYYYRSKEKLFMAVFKYAFTKVIPKIEKEISTATTFEVKIRLFIENYMDILLKHPYIPLFIMQEINRNPDELYKVVMDSGVKPKELFSFVQSEINKGRIKPVDPHTLIINMLSLCIFPVAAKPLLQRIFFNNNEKAYKEFLNIRVGLVTEMILADLKNIPLSE